MTSSEWAAWVQAVGAVVAIAATVALTRTDQRQRRIEAKARRLSAAVAIFPVIAEVASGLKWALGQVEAGHRPDEIGSDGPEPEDTIHFWNTAVMPAKLEALRPILHDLGADAEPVQRAFLSLDILRQDFRDFASSNRHEGPEYTWGYSEKEWAQTHALALEARERTRLSVVVLKRIINTTGT